MALLKQKGMTVNQLLKTLEKEGINAVFKKNGEGLLNEIIYVDFVSKCVFNGSVLGKQYSAQAIEERCGLGMVIGQKTIGFDNEKSHEYSTQADNYQIDKTAGDAFLKNKLVESNTVIAKVVDILTQFEQTAMHVPSQLKSKRKRKGQSYTQ